jgi:hypothetical protein
MGLWDRDRIADCGSGLSGMEGMMNVWEGRRNALIFALVLWIVGFLAIYGAWHLYLNHFSG